MEKLNRILHHPSYVNTMEKIEELEKEREFCCHGIDHSLTVARMMYITALEEDLAYSKSMIYAAALLHDIGRSVVLVGDSTHAQAGLSLAEDILGDAGYEKAEITEILKAMASHGHDKEEGLEKDSFSYLLSRCDRLSRNCFYCKVKSLCYWDDIRKNEDIYL